MPTQDNQETDFPIISCGTPERLIRDQRLKEKKEEILLSPMTKAPIPAAMSIMKFLKI